MLETPHAILGATIATAIPNPTISLPLAFVSHFILDMVPHWNPHINTEINTYGKLTNRTFLIIGLDVVLALTTTILISKSNPYAYIGSFLAILPDAVEAPYFIWGWKNKFLTIWMKFQKAIQSDTNVFWGLLTQIAVLVACYFWIF